MQTKSQAVTQGHSEPWLRPVSQTRGCGTGRKVDTLIVEPRAADSPVSQAGGRPPGRRSCCRLC